MKRTIITALVLAIYMSSPAFGNNKKMRRSKTPNIIVIYADDMGYGDLGATGHPDIKTPNLDKMALNGMRFTNYYAPSPASTASRYGLLTGRYPIRSGFRWVLDPTSEKGIHPRETTLPEALKAEGYATGMFGKWHLGSTKKEYLPLQNGFDEYVGFPYSNDMIPPKYPDMPLMNGNDTIALNPDQSILTKLYTEKAISFIKKNRKDKFFIYLPYAMPHAPLHPGPEFRGKSKRGAYGDVVEEIDWYVGQLLKTLKEEGLEENTIVWFTSDNGPWILKNEEGGSAGLFRDGKGSTWEGGVRVPCIVQWKGTVSAGVVNEEIVNAMDIYATSINIAGGEVPSDRVVDGRIITSYLNPKSGIPDKEKVPYFYYGLNNQLMAVRKGSWKLHVKTYSQLNIDYFKKIPLLFDLYVDPSEKYDLSEKYPEIVKELEELIVEQNKNAKEIGSFFDTK